MNPYQVYNEPAKQVWQRVYGNITQTRILEQIKLITTYFHNTMQIHHSESLGVRSLISYIILFVNLLIMKPLVNKSGSNGKSQFS
jgi:hypothetical protein